MFILDMSSGNLCNNSTVIIEKMINAVAEIDHKRIIILKWQLFKEAGNNIPLDREIFRYAYEYAKDLGFKTTASVFDIDSLNFLLQFDISFVKIANRPDLYWLIGKVPREIPVIVSGQKVYYNSDGLCCISKYPATMEEYEQNFMENDLRSGISDHTCSWELFRKYHPENYECHFCLSHDPQNPDGGMFARLPSDIKEIYNDIK